MAIHTKLARKILTKREQDHLTFSGIRSMNIFKSTRKQQIEWGEKSEHIACFTCQEIARKLGL
jgi:hypothetical protein